VAEVLIGLIRGSKDQFSEKETETNSWANPGLFTLRDLLELAMSFN